MNLWFQNNLCEFKANSVGIFLPLLIDEKYKDDSQGKPVKVGRTKLIQLVYIVVIFWFNEINNTKDLVKNNLYKHRVGRPEPKLPLSTLCMMKFLKVRSFWRNQLLLLAKTVIHLQQWICALPSDLSSVLFYSFKHYRVALNSYGQKSDITYI